MSLTRRIFLAGAITAAIVSVAAPAFGAPASSSSTSSAFDARVRAKQAQIDAYNTQLDSLNTQAEYASEAWNKASDELTSTNLKVQSAEIDLANARAALALQTEILDKRINSIYKDGSLSTFEVLLDSKSLGDFVARIKFLNVIGLNDANLAGQLRSQKDLMERQLEVLQGQQARAQQLEFELKARKIEAEQSIADVEKLTKSAQGDLSAILNQEAAVQQTRQAALVSSIRSGTNKAGIVATPGSPVETALAYLGIPYVWGGATPSGFDCSGLVMYVFAQHGVTLPHYSGYQFLQGLHIALTDIQPNDVVFFGNPVHHVGLYIGGGYFIEAPHTGAFVRIAKLATRGDIAGVRRYAWQPRTAPILGGKTSTSSALSQVP
jgi:peptidoglycan DL-endopeptidase CwlO